MCGVCRAQRRTRPNQQIVMPLLNGEKMPKFQKRPIVIEARQSTGTPESNRDIIDWTRDSRTPASMDDHPERGKCLTISTLEGVHWVLPGDWVIRGVQGEFYPCKPDIFAQTYEAVDEAA